MMPEPELEPSAAGCLERTRSGVLNVLVVAGLGIAVSGWVLGRHDPSWPLPWSLEQTRRASMAGLVVLSAFGYLVLRVGAGRESLRDPSFRASRFFKARVGAAIAGAFAVPMGFAFGWMIDPHLPAIAPFWIAALGLGFLAFPRGPELTGFDEPMAG